MEYLQYTEKNTTLKLLLNVLNLIINGIPSILFTHLITPCLLVVLNLIINGIPSIPFAAPAYNAPNYSFKPYYKWNTFNTKEVNMERKYYYSFKPYYKWNTFNTYQAVYLMGHNS